jgi:hypothetical protein
MKYEFNESFQVRHSSVDCDCLTTVPDTGPAAKNRWDMSQNAPLGVLSSAILELTTRSLLKDVWREQLTS